MDTTHAAYSKASRCRCCPSSSICSAREWSSKPNVLTRFSAALGEEIAQIKQATNTLVGGRQFNIASNKQLGEILIDEWGAPPTRRLKTGWSMNADALDRLRNRSGLDDRIYELIDAVLRFRELSKLKSTYADSLPKMVNPETGRVHTTFNQAGFRHRSARQQRS